jgi:KUP system potassium uptake protein
VFHERVALMSFVFERRPRVPFGERHKVERLGHGFYRVQVRLGFMQTPDIPRTLQNIQLLGFDSDLDRKHYYLAHETVVRREKIPPWGRSRLRSFLFSARFPAGARLFQQSPRRGHRSGLPRRNLTAAETP